MISATVVFEPRRPPELAGDHQQDLVRQTALVAIFDESGHRVVDLPAEGLNLEDYLESIRRQLMREALDRSRGVQTQAAELLGISFRSFRYYAKKAGLTGKDSAAAAAPAASSGEGTAAEEPEA